ncbi:hypothetical protein [Pantoea sp. C2G6]|uniref:hypothetical protein n=1 Tax=Pantoea sp. C2G6 TaxID=3243084 RepID=UPI003ED96C36
MQNAQAAKVDVNPRSGQICKATAAMTFGRDYKIMQLDKVDADGIAYVHYNRPSDNTRWAIKCRLEGDRVLWASDNPDSTGRWRNHPADAVITYSINGNNLTLKQLYSDGSGESARYDLK